MRRSRLRPGSPLKVRLNADGNRRERFEGVLANEPDHRCWHPEHISDPHHVETKARGAGDQANLIPVCRAAHDEIHSYGVKSFERTHRETLGGKPLRQIAGEYWLAYEREKGVGAL